MISMDRPGKGILVSVSKFKDDQVKIAVTDHGNGIAKEAEENIFLPFFTTKSAGMGLGLAICQSIIESHGGVLSFTKNPSGGTTFYFTLPAISEKKT